MKLTDSEWLIMDALWRQHPATARDVSGLLPDEKEWAYTTIKTMLNRLVEKGAVSERKVGNVSLYEPLVSRDKARRSAIRSLIDRAFGGSFEPMINFLAKDREISEEQRRKLLEMLDEEKRPEGES